MIVLSYVWFIKKRGDVLYGSETGDWGEIQDGVTVVKA
jgi:hypothetical protein